jgi:hypothetical protein
LTTQDDYDNRMTQGYFTGHSDKSLEEALYNASENAKGFRKGPYRVVHIEIDVDKSIHDYKVLIGP